ncbi:hypothetical protein EON65_40100 [archaeon]|nr:MAG: hypothetical protein EON65_40100 [archaeon]
MKDNKASTKPLPSCANPHVTASASGAGVGVGAKKKQSTFRRMLPILASAFCAAAIMYPLDLVRALQMANAGTSNPPVPAPNTFLHPSTPKNPCAQATYYFIDGLNPSFYCYLKLGSGLTTGQLLANFKNDHGVIGMYKSLVPSTSPIPPIYPLFPSGFFTQGLVPELARSTWMRFVKFALFPLVHEGLFHVGK